MPPLPAVLEFVNGGPLDGEELPVFSPQVRVASRHGITQKLHQYATPDLVRRIPHHVYEIGIEECGEGCCTRFVMAYCGMAGADT